MVNSDFNRIIDRKGTWSLKHDFSVERGKPADVLPLWVADMDFAGPDCIREDLTKLASSGIFGYSDVKADYYEAVRKWFSDRFGWETKNEWIVKTPGVVFAITMAIRAFTDPGDYVLIQSPVYYPFYDVICHNNRKVADNQLIYENGRYRMNLEELEDIIIKNKVKLMLLCSPHNPVGRVWTEDELQDLGAILKRHNAILLSDEIHCDIVYKPNVHHVFPVTVPDMAEQTIVCTAPSKTFNIAGLQVSNIFIENETLRRRFKHELYSTGYSQLNLPGLIACKSAYTGGAEWLSACLAYLEANLSYIREFVKKEMPGVRMVEPEGTYFAWLDFNKLGLRGENLENIILNQAKLWLDGGNMFGKAGDGFQRIVYACPREMLVTAMNRMKEAVYSNK